MDRFFKRNTVTKRTLSLFHQGSYVPVPDWLVAIGGEPTPYQDTMEITERIHPDDGAAVSDLGIAAWNSPGEVVRGTYRFRWEDEWMRARSEAVVLTDERCTGMLTAAWPSRRLISAWSTKRRANSAVWLATQVSCSPMT